LLYDSLLILNFTLKIGSAKIQFILILQDVLRFFIFFCLSNLPSNMNRYNRNEIHHLIYLFGLALLITCIPLSMYLLSIAQFLLALNWIVEGDFRKKADRLRTNGPVILFASVFLLYAIGYFYSVDKLTGIIKLKNALPLFALPLIIGTTPHPGERNMNRLLLLFSLGVLAAAIACIVNYIINGLPPGGDYRQISIFRPHIRFSILIVMAIFILANFAFYKGIVIENFPIKKRSQRIIFIIAAVFLTGFLFFLRSATGILIFLIVAIVFISNVFLSSPVKALRYSVFILISLITFSFISLITITWINNFHPPKDGFIKLEVYTVNGNPYYHDTISGILENGNFTGIYLCEPELMREWEKVSKTEYYGFDSKGQAVRSTLIRYLTSKGMRKDSLSVHMLTGEDIINIENGLPNYKFRNDPGAFQRVYETLYEIHIFRRSGYVERHSFGQRLAFAKASASLIAKNFWTGVGAGDVYNLLRQQTQEDNISIDPKWEGKPHNQFAFYWLAFGTPGLMWILFCWIYPAIRRNSFKSLIFNLFALIILASMLAMDTMESYDSMVFFAFFYSLLVLSDKAVSMNSENS
jgi:hypothetical protein